MSHLTYAPLRNTHHKVPQATHGIHWAMAPSKWPAKICGTGTLDCLATRKCLAPAAISLHTPKRNLPSLKLWNIGKGLSNKDPMKLTLHSPTELPKYKLTKLAASYPYSCLFSWCLWCVCNLGGPLPGRLGENLCL